MSPQPYDVTAIKGGASDERKENVHLVFHMMHAEGTFGQAITDRTRVIEVDNTEKGGGKNGRAVYEVVVEKDMLNGLGTMHGGCTGLLIDACTSGLLSIDDHWNFEHVSSALNINYHSPAPEGSRLRIVCTIVALGGRVGTTRCEIWDADRERLVASGVHTKMKPSSAKAKL